MKTIYLSLILIFATTLSLRAQFLSYEAITPFADSHMAPPQDFLFADELNFGITFSPFAVQSSLTYSFNDLSPSEDWLVNRFGANYLPNSDGYLDIPYGTQENALKIPIGNGPMLLTFIGCLYILILFIREKLWVEEFA